MLTPHLAGILVYQAGLDCSESVSQCLPDEIYWDISEGFHFFEILTEIGVGSRPKLEPSIFTNFW